MASAFGGTSQDWGGSFRAQDVEMSGFGGPKSLAQSVQFTCNRTVNFLYEIGGSNVYYVGDRRQGQCQATKVVGGQNVAAQYGDLCAPQELTMNAKGGCGGAAGGRKFILKFAVLNSMGASTTAQDVVITEQMGFVFADLDVT